MPNFTYVCSNCGHTRFRTKDKSKKIYECRKCGSTGETIVTTMTPEMKNMKGKQLLEYLKNPQPIDK